MAHVTVIALSIVLKNDKMYEFSMHFLDDCNFDSGFCSFTNPTTATDDDFDWSLGRSSIKRGTGPSRDQFSSNDFFIESGGYAYIESGYPRKPFDKARLVSADIPMGPDPICLTFWVHMYGGGIGTLRYKMFISSFK